jgi:hypothetical protein
MSTTTSPTYQARLVDERNSYIREIETSRNSITVGIGKNSAGLTVRDNSLRTVYCPLTLESIVELTFQLELARLHLASDEDSDQCPLPIQNRYQ